ncbi:Pentatricopeptide repeat-containing protein [Thalictrum thalictroides]|uniref:Pentatricopeptide repeat-containing protein n=1 Tax=Thalictrum thalictroides TaxID=46969 RepID=A0A7J6VDN8_THATH|nr:Pentatricopeptide repeat-containing protein [Thalictrum thalictroides]
MRNQLKLLLLRNVCSSRTSFQIPTTNLQVLKVGQSFSHLSSFLSRNVHENVFNSEFRNHIRSCSSESALELNKEVDHIALTDILSKASSNDEIKTGLESINVSINPDMVLNSLQTLEGKPEIAWKFFEFVSEMEHEKLGSKSYYLMLDILGRKDFGQSFWDLLDVMHKKNYKLSREMKGRVLIEILSKSSSNDEIRDRLESIDLTINHERVLSMLEELKGCPEIAWKFFNFVSETANKKLSSKSYNLMLEILGKKDYVEQFWGLFEIMKKKGYRLSKVTYVKILEKREIIKGLDELKEMYGSIPDQNSVDWLCSRTCKILRTNEWGEEAQKRLNDLNCSWTNDLVAMVIEHIKEQPLRALMFFRWIEENPSFKHSKLSYNAMLKVLGREDCLGHFWQIVDEMKKTGFLMDMEIFSLVMARFYKRKIVKDAVDLYEFMMGSVTKPSLADSVLLMRKIVSGKELDMDLFSRCLMIFTDGGNSLTYPILDLVVKSLTSVGRLQECGKILKAMENGGFVPTNEVYNGIIFKLSSVKRSDEAIQIFEKMEASGCNPDVKTWFSLINGQCVARELDQALSSFINMVTKVGVADAGDAFEVLMKAFCRKKRAGDAYKFLSEMVDGTELRPLQTTYNRLIENLLGQQSFDEALSLLRLMKGHGYPPHLNPFVDYISKSGTGTDALLFLRAVTNESESTLSTPVFIFMFEAFFKAGRHNEANNLFSMCPNSICNHADVLKLFASQKPEDTDASAVSA